MIIELPRNNIAGMTHQGDDIRHRYRPDSQKKWGERAANSGGYTNKSSDVWFYVAIIGFFVFLRFLPWILRRLGCIPPRPERVVLRRDPGEEETTEELSEEERKMLVTKSLSTTKVTKHSPDICSGECLEKQHVGTGKEDPSRISLASVSTMTADEEEDEEEGIERAREDVGVGDEASSNDDQTTLSPCHICLDHFRIGEEISWSNVSKCEHCFHSKCINEWLLKHQACPLCRANMLDLTSLQRHSEEGREDDDSGEMDEQAADVQVEIAHGSDTSCNSVPVNEENLSTAEEGKAKSTNVDATEKREGEALGETMCFCVEHGLRVQMA